MEKLFGLVIFAVIGGLWLVLQLVSKAQARKAAMERYDRQGSDEDFSMEPEESEYDYTETAPPPHRERAAAVPRPKAAPAAPIPAPERHSPKGRRAGSSYARFIRKNTREAIMMQEILGPPKGLQ